MLTPRTRDGWTLLIAAVLLASTIVTASFAAVLTSLLFPGGFLIDSPAPPPAGLVETIPPSLNTAWPSKDPTTTGTAAPQDEPPDLAAATFGWRASVSCSVTLQDF